MRHQSVVRAASHPRFTGQTLPLPGIRCAGGLALMTLVLCGTAGSLNAQTTGAIQAEATVLPAEGTRTFQLVSQMLRATRRSTFAARRPDDPMPLASIVIDSDPPRPGARSRRVVVTIQYLRN
jgi:hypothetical protein